MKFSIELSENDLYLAFVCAISMIIFMFMGTSFSAALLSAAFLFLYFKFLHGVFIVVRKVVISLVGKPLDRTLPDLTDKKKTSETK